MTFFMYSCRPTVFNQLKLSCFQYKDSVGLFRNASSLGGARLNKLASLTKSEKISNKVNI